MTQPIEDYEIAYTSTEVKRLLSLGYELYGSPGWVNGKLRQAMVKRRAPEPEPATRYFDTLGRESTRNGGSRNRWEVKPDGTVIYRNNEGEETGALYPTLDRLLAIPSMVETDAAGRRLPNQPRQ